MFLRAAGLLETGPRSTSAFQKYSGKGSVVFFFLFFLLFCFGKCGFMEFREMVCDMCIRIWVFRCYII